MNNVTQARKLLMKFKESNHGKLDASEITDLDQAIVLLGESEFKYQEYDQLVNTAHWVRLLWMAFRLLEALIQFFG